MDRQGILPMTLACCGSLWLAGAVVSPAGPESSSGTRARRIEGRVLGAEGWPLPGATVYVLLDAADRPAGGPPLLQTTTGEDGRFSFEALDPGTYRIDIEARDHQLAHVGAHLPEGTTPFVPLEVHMRPQTTSSRAAGSGRARPAPATTTPEPSPLVPETATRSTEPAPIEASSATADVRPEEPLAPGPEATRREPDEVHSELLRLVGAGQIPQAQAMLAQLPGHRPEDADLFYAVGEALLRAGEPRPALQAFDEAIARDPAHAEARYRRALALLGEGRRAEARAEFSRVLELRPAGPLADGARKALDALAPAGSSR